MSYYSWKEGLPGLVAIALFAALVGFIPYYVYTFGNDEDDYEIICLGGHEYWKMNFLTKTSLAVKLNSDGKPVSCNGAKDSEILIGQ